MDRIYTVKRVGAGFIVHDMCRDLGISRATYMWRAKCDGMVVPMMSRMKEL